MPRGEKEKLNNAEAEILSQRLDAYLRLTGKTKKGLSEEMGFSKDYISGLTRLGRFPKYVQIHLDHMFKEFGYEQIDEKVKEIEFEKRAKEAFEKVHKQMNQQPVQLFQDVPTDIDKAIEHIQVLGEKLDKITFQLLQIAGIIEGFVETWASVVAETNVPEQKEESNVEEE